MKKVSILASAILLSACNSAPNQEVSSDVNRNYVVSVTADKMVNKVIADKIDALPSFFNVYKANSINKQASYITTDYINASYQALLTLHKEQVELKLRNELFNEVLNMHMLNKGTAPLKLAQEMIYSLSIGMMLPTHSREVGKEFSMIYKADGTALSPTLNSELEYSKFSIDSKVCKLDRKEARAVRILAYINAMNTDLFTELFALNPELATVTQAITANSKVLSVNKHTTAKATSVGSCFDYMLARNPVDLTYAVKSLTKEVPIQETLAKNKVTSIEQKQTADTVKNSTIKSYTVKNNMIEKGLLLLSTASVELEENTPLYHEIVLNLNKANKKDHSHYITAALPLFEQIEKLSTKKAKNIAFNNADKQFLNVLNKKLSYILTGKAKPYLAYSFYLDKDSLENITFIEWRNLYKTTELIKEKITYKGIKICNKPINKADLLDISLMALPLCE